MIRKLIILGLVIIITSNLSITIERKENNVETLSWNSILPLQTEKEIATLTIDKIHLQEKLYSKDSPHNTVEQNLAFLKESNMPDRTNGIVLIAGHSGTGPLAYFKNLDKVSILDKINISYQQKDYEYTVTQYLVQDKNGTIRFSTNKEKGYLVLTTCMPHEPGKQLVLIAEATKRA